MKNINEILNKLINISHRKKNNNNNKMGLIYMTNNYLKNYVEEDF